MKYANLIAATRSSSVGAAAFSEDSAFKDCQFVARHFHSAVPLAPPAVFFFFIYIIIISEQRRFHEMLDSAGSRGFFAAISYFSASSCQSRSLTKCPFVFLSSFLLSAPTQMLEPPTLPGIVSCMLCVLCGGLNLLRGVHAIESILQVRHPEERKKKKNLKKLFGHLSQESLSAGRLALCLHKLSLSAPLSE